MFSFQQPPVPQPPPEPKKDSSELSRLKSLGDRLFQASCGATGFTAAHWIRSTSPRYFPLFILGTGAVILFLAVVPPRDKEFLGLHRSGAIALLLASLLAFWDLLIAIPIQNAIAIGAVLLLVAIAVVALLGRD